MAALRAALVLIVLVAVVVTLMVGLIVVLGGVVRPLVWELPPGYHGWVLTEYDVAGCPSLRTRGWSILIPVSTSGRACTSSSHPLPVWRYFHYEYAYPDGKRTELRVTASEGGGDIWGAFSAPKQPSFAHPFEGFFVGTEAEFKRNAGSEPRP